MRSEAFGYARGNGHSKVLHLPHINFHVARQGVQPPKRGHAIRIIPKPLTSSAKRPILSHGPICLVARSRAVLKHACHDGLAPQGREAWPSSLYNVVWHASYPIPSHQLTKAKLSAAGFPPHTKSDSTWQWPGRAHHRRRRRLR